MNRVIEALTSLQVGLEPVEVTELEGGAKALFRLRGDPTKWLSCIEFLLKKEKVSDWSFSVCRRYFVKQSLVWGWEVEFYAEGDQIDALISSIRNSLGYSSPTKGPIMKKTDTGYEVEVMPLPGAEHIQDRNAPKPGKFKGAKLL